MKKVLKNKRHSIQFKKTKFIDRIIIFLIRAISNYFWAIIDIFSHDNKKIANMYKKSTGEEYKFECKSLNIQKGKKILHIGCGSFPLTEITLANLFDIKITGIDKNRKAVKRARQVILKEKLDEKVNIMQGNGINFPVFDFDLIIVSGCALPKKEILNHVFSTSKKNSKIIIRELEALTEETINCIDKDRNIALEKKIFHPSHIRFFLGWDAFHVKKN